MEGNIKGHLFTTLFLLVLLVGIIRFLDYWGQVAKAGGLFNSKKRQVGGFNG